MAQSVESSKTGGKRGIQKFREGIVVSNNMTKTVVVSITRLTKHSSYGKFIRKTAKLYAHDEKECGVGDLVRVREMKPMSKLKRWKVIEVIRKAD